MALTWLAAPRFGDAHRLEDGDRKGRRCWNLLGTVNQALVLCMAPMFDRDGLDMLVCGTLNTRRGAMTSFVCARNRACD